MAEMRKIETVLRKFKEYDQLSDILSLDRRFEGTITIVCRFYSQKYYNQ